MLAEYEILLDNDCSDNILCIKWLNSLGSWSYELFKFMQNAYFDYQNFDTGIYSQENSREITIKGQTRAGLMLTKDSIIKENAERFLDLLKSGKQNDLWIFSKKYRIDFEGFDTYSEIYGAVKFELKNHKFETGDIVNLYFETETGQNGRYIVTKIDNDNFYILDLSLTISDAGYLIREVQATDWIRCQIVEENNTLSNVTDNNIVNLKVLAPSNFVENLINFE